MREITNQATRSLKGSVGRINNRCVRRYDCQKRNDACKTCLHANRSMLCRLCRQCNSHCRDFVEHKVGARCRIGGRRTGNAAGRESPTDADRGMGIDFVL